MSLSKTIAKAPIVIYRYTLSAFIGRQCRHFPSCSEYGIEAIEKNGAWRGLWLTLARVLRCNPWGSQGHDPVPDIRSESHPFAPWLYGRWRLRPVNENPK